MGRVAILDLGSNSTRVFLCEGIGPEGPQGERITTVTALRRGAAADGTITPDALGRLDDCLAGYAQRIAAFVPDQVIAVGTSAVRDAPNGAEVARVVRDRLGEDLRVLSGAQEAELAYVGARLAVDGAGPLLVMDIGGGSTELVRGGPDGPHSAVSMDIGCVRQTEQHITSDPPTGQAVAALIAEARDTAANAFAIIGTGAPMIGVAGTMTSLAAITLGRYDPTLVHRAQISLAQVTELVTRLSRLTLAERQAVPGLHPDRAPAIVAGACIAAGVMQAAGVATVTVSERDLLDGAVLRLSASGR